MIEWFTVYGIIANPNKFQLISFGNTHKNRSAINVNGVILNNHTNIKYLGINFDNKLPFSTHVDSIYTKADKLVSALLRMSNSLDHDIKFVIYKSFINCSFMYSQLAWSFCSKTDMSKLEKLQCREQGFVGGDFAMRSSDLIKLFDI